MKTSREFPKKLSQKGAGMLEYALLFGFVVAVFLIVFSEGGFGDAVGNLFGSSGDSVNSVEFDSGSSSGGGSGSSSVASLISDSGSATTSTTSESTATENTAEVTYKPLNWVRDILPFADMTYSTIVATTKSNTKANDATVDSALSSELGFINTLFTAVEGGLASTNAADGTKDWETFLNMMDSTKTKNNISSSYMRGEEKITIKKVGKDLRVTYSDKENSVYYKLSPDANNVMQVETNSNKSYSEFFSPILKEKGWSYGD